MLLFIDTVLSDIQRCLPAQAWNAIYAQHNWCIVLFCDFTPSTAMQLETRELPFPSCAIFLIDSDCIAIAIENILYPKGDVVLRELNKYLMKIRISSNVIVWVQLKASSKEIPFHTLRILQAQYRARAFYLSVRVPSVSFFFPFACICLLYFSFYAFIIICPFQKSPCKRMEWISILARLIYSIHTTTHCWHESNTLE